MKKETKLTFNKNWFILGLIVAVILMISLPFDYPINPIKDANLVLIKFSLPLYIILAFSLLGIDIIYEDKEITEETENK